MAGLECDELSDIRFMCDGKGDLGMAREWLAFCGDSRLGLKGRDVHDVWGDALLSQLSKLEIFSSFLGHEIVRTRRLLVVRCSEFATKC